MRDQIRDPNGAEYFRMVNLRNRIFVKHLLGNALDESIESNHLLSSLINHGLRYKKGQGIVEKSEESEKARVAKFVKAGGNAKKAVEMICSLREYIKRFEEHTKRQGIDERSPLFVNGFGSTLFQMSLTLSALSNELKSRTAH